MPIWTFVNLGEYSLVSTDTTQLRPYESRPPAPRANLKDILLAVLPVALIMSGFFWIGYWTAASNDYPAEPAVISEPREAQSTPSSGDKEESSAEASREEQAAGQEYHHWVEL